MTTVSSFHNLNQESFVFTPGFSKNDFITLCNTKLTLPIIKHLYAVIKGSATKKRNTNSILHDIFDDLHVKDVRIAIGMIKLLLNDGASSSSNRSGTSSSASGDYTSDEAPSSELSIEIGVQFKIKIAVFMIRLNVLPKSSSVIPPNANWCASSESNI
jgi:hypothetical protein